MTQLAFGQAVALALYQTLVNPLSLLIWGAVGILNICTYIGIGSIIILVISSFVAPHSTHPIIVLAGQLLEPILRPARKLIPPVGGLDFSVMLAGMGIFISQKLIYALAVTVALQPKLIIGF